MFSYIKGTIESVCPPFVVVDCGGVGFGMHSTANTLKKLPDEGTLVKLFTYLAVREDAMELYGFIDKAELECFKMMLSVSGVGNKVGIAILSELTPESFCVAVASGNVKALTAASGVGPKLAQRIILELKDKVSKDYSNSGNLYESDEPLAGERGDEAVKALMVLGYSANEAKNAVKKHSSGAASVEDLVRLSLKSLI